MQGVMVMEHYVSTKGVFVRTIFLMTFNPVAGTAELVGICNLHVM